MSAEPTRPCEFSQGRVLPFGKERCLRKICVSGQTRRFRTVKRGVGKADAAFFQSFISLCSIQPILLT